MQIQEIVYTVVEDTSTGVVPVCAQLNNGTLERNVTLTLTTENGMAMSPGMWSLLLLAV